MTLSRTLLRPKRLLYFLVSLLCVLTLHTSAKAQRIEKPRLVVLISIDQFRADYLTRFEDLFLPATSGGRVGGFRYLMSGGAYFPDAHHDHLPLATGPGHSIHFTGAPPYKSGIIANDWYDRSIHDFVYCVQDNDSPYVPNLPLSAKVKLRGVSAKKLQVTTIGDELKMATGGKAKVFGIALKDRAAVLMAGHLADGVYWFDDNYTGGWVSSTAYCRDGKLPDWLAALNADKAHGPDAYLGKDWTLHPKITARDLDRLWVPPGKDRATYAASIADDVNGLGVKFPHTLTRGTVDGKLRTYQSFTPTPYANEYVLYSAKQLIQNEKLGQDDITDVLAINLSSNDYTGHAYGPDSAEVLDITVKTDEQLSGFLNDLNRTVPGGLANVTFIITADHGAPPNGKAMMDSGINGGNWSAESVETPAKEALTKAFGEAKWVVLYKEPYLWIDHAMLDEKNISHDKAEEVVAAAVQKVKGIYAAYQRHSVLIGQLPRTDIAKHVTLGFHQSLSGDLALISQPFWMPRDKAEGVTHAEPYAYDTRVPILISGFGIRPGTYTERVSTLDIAPTLAFLLHVQQPSGCEGHILSRAVTADGPNRR